MIITKSQNKITIIYHGEYMNQNNTINVFKGIKPYLMIFWGHSSWFWRSVPIPWHKKDKSNTGNDTPNISGAILIYREPFLSY
jgi:hypothetical protein